MDPIFTREAVERTGAMYLAGADPHQPLLGPAVLADLTGFPPMLVQVGTNEILLDDSTRLAAAVRLGPIRRERRWSLPPEVELRQRGPGRSPGPRRPDSSIAPWQHYRTRLELMR
ncbi:alpha/beta hydrolase fold domain-containing protein [Streptomyces sp. NPDC127063]|uniref:alpha/beta hydrolase fold domain-containing protein n=1 Tax=Streptomyces sp. NPDC127063 TaxID=3347123 RepID=UPI003664636A